ncbi:hypothetical protein ID866_8763 [Astraeus odoratus]|nr:hypothetical protein ID866_8763 [Astraeus odoratus]
MSSPSSVQNGLFAEDHGQLQDTLDTQPVDTGFDATCSHISATLADPSKASGLKTKYKTVVAWYVRKTQDTVSAPPAKRRRVAAPACDTCHLTLSRPFVCLSCPFAGCWVGGHIETHLAESSHPFCVDTKTGSLFCSECENFVIILSCIDRLLRNQIYSTSTTPFGPTSFLATSWKVSAELSGYAQQDAHEFFITALNQIHGTCRGSTNISCNCIVHQTFAGQLQSEVTCERCGSVTRTVDPMLDISLELRDAETEKETTLAGCLRRYTKAEKLGREYTCNKCAKATHEAVRRLSIRKLPPVLSFQFKRFEHKTVSKGTPQKIDTPVRFPVTINMAPYTTAAVNANGKDGDITLNVANENPVMHNPRGQPALGPSCRHRYPGPVGMYEYELFAVINHEGQMENGHYTNFARFQDEWYRFDDDKVTHSSLGDCLNSNAYMCFYVKRYLDYKPYMKPTYRVARENDIVREQEQEKLREMARMKEVDDALMATIAGD